MTISVVLKISHCKKSNSKSLSLYQLWRNFELFLKFVHRRKWGKKNTTYIIKPLLPLEKKNKHTHTWDFRSIKKLSTLGTKTIKSPTYCTKSSPTKKCQNEERTFFTAFPSLPPSLTPTNRRLSDPLCSKIIHSGRNDKKRGEQRGKCLPHQKRWGVSIWMGEAGGALLPLVSVVRRVARPADATGDEIDSWWWRVFWGVMRRLLSHCLFILFEIFFGFRVFCFLSYISFLFVVEYLSCFLYFNAFG